MVAVPAGYERVGENSFVKRDSLGRVVEQRDYNSSGEYTYKSWYYPNNKLMKAVKPLEEANYNAAGQLSGNRRVWFYPYGSKNATRYEVEVWDNGVLVRGNTRGLEGSQKYEVTTPSGEKVRTSNPVAAREYLEKQPDQKFRAQSPSGLYTIEYEGKKYPTSNPEFKPEPLRKAEQRAVLKQSFYDTYQEGRTSPMLEKPITPPTVSERPRFVPVTNEEYKKWVAEHPSSFSQAPPVTLDFTSRGSAEQVKQAAFYTEQGVPLTFKFSEPPSKIEKFLSDQSYKISYLESKASDFIFPDGKFDPGRLTERISEKTGLFYIPPEKKIEVSFKSDEQLAGGIRKQFVEKPLETAVTYGLGYAFGAGTAAGEYALTRFGAGKLVESKILSFAPEALMSVYAGGVSYKVLSSSEPEVELGREVARGLAFGGGLKASGGVASRFKFLTSVEQDIRSLPYSERVAVRAEYSPLRAFVTPERYVSTEVRLKGDVSIERSLLDKFGPDQFRTEVVSMKPDEFAQFLSRRGKISYFPESTAPSKRKAYGYYEYSDEPYAIDEIHIGKGLKGGFREEVTRHELMHYVHPEYSEAEVLKLGRYNNDFFTPLKQPVTYGKGVLVEESFANAEVKVSKSVGSTLLGTKTYKVQVASEKMISQTGPEYEFRNIVKVSTPTTLDVYAGGGEGRLYTERVAKTVKLEKFAGQQVPLEINEAYRVSGYEEEKLIKIASGKGKEKLTLLQEPAGISKTQFGGRIEETKYPIYGEITGKYSRVKDTGLFTGKAKTAYILGQRQTLKDFAGSTGEFGSVASYNVQGTKFGRYETGKGSIEGLEYPEVVPNQDLILLYEERPDVYRFVKRPLGKKAQLNVGVTETTPKSPEVKVDSGFKSPAQTGLVSAGRAAEASYLSQFKPVFPGFASTNLSSFKLNVQPLPSASLTPISKSNIIPSTKPSNKIINKSEIFPASKPISKPVDKIISKPVSKPISKTFSKPVAKPLTKTISKPLTTPFNYPLNRSPPNAPNIFKFSESGLSFGKSLSPKQSKPLTKYTPSLYASVSDIEAKLSKKRKSKEQITGLTVRPLPLKVKVR